MGCSTGVSACRHHHGSVKQAWPIAWRPWRSQRHCAAPPQELAHELGAAQDAYFRHSWPRHLPRPPCRYDSLAERSKAVAQGAIPKGRGFEPHSCQCARPSTRGGLLHGMGSSPTAVNGSLRMYCTQTDRRPRSSTEIPPASMPWKLRNLGIVWPSGLRRVAPGPIPQGSG